MSNCKVLITCPLLEKGLECFYHNGLDIEIVDSITVKEIINQSTSYFGIVSMLSHQLDSDFFSAIKGSSIKVIANHAVGYDNIDIVAAKDAGIWVTNTPDVLTIATAELAWALVFSASRRIGEGERLIRNNLWNGWEPTQLIGQDIFGKTVGIIGAGRIGQAFAKMGSGFNLKFLYHNRARDLLFEEQCQAKYCSLDQLLIQSDIISIHLPSSPETIHLLSEEKLSLLKTSAVLVNTGRGNIIDEAALAKILKSGKIAAAGLDVYEQEPGIHSELLSLDNVVLAPHIGSASVKARVGMARLCADNIAAVYAGKTPPNALTHITKN